MADLCVALAGNPNAGKTTVFNALTGSRQHVGNWPGKTVERKVGHFRHDGVDVKVIDLPGTYSLSAYSQEEVVARDGILHEAPDLVVVVVDASNLERNLYLVVQILEMQASVLIALNMGDIVDALGITIDDARLAELLGAPVMRLVASRGEGIAALKQAIVQRARVDRQEGDANAPEQQVERPAFRMNYGNPIEAAIEDIEAHIRRRPELRGRYDPRWLAIKLLEGDPDLAGRLEGLEGGASLLQGVRERVEKLAPSTPEGVQIAIADLRYQFVNQVVAQCTKAPKAVRPSLTERIDNIVTHPWLGIPIFLAVMYLMFNLVVNVSAPYLDWIDDIIQGPVSNWLLALLQWAHSPAWLQSLLLDGVIAGVGGVLVFIPGLIVLFAFIAALEDSGYMARAAFVMNRFLTFLGLNGKSFVPLILGFGCAVPAIYATRTLDRQRDRLLTTLLIPFMSCAARLPVYVVFGLAFFGRRAFIVIWALYSLGIAIAVVAGLVFSRTILRSATGRHFVMELPSYHMPTLNSLWLHVSQNVGRFIHNAGTIILAASIVIWALLNLPLDRSDLRHSLFGEVSAIVAPVLAPAGFGNWESAGALMTGLIAKEVVVSTMSQIYVGEESQPTAVPELNILDDLKGIGTGFLSATIDAGKELLQTFTPGLKPFGSDGGPSSRDTALGAALRSVFSTRAALAFLVFVLLYIPCVATLGAIRDEFGGRWAAFSAVYQTAIAWLLATAVYQIGAWFV